MNQTLIVYLSREGQTRKIAECLAAELRLAGRPVAVAELTAVSTEVLAAAGQIVVGASIHYGRLPAVLYAFVAQHQPLPAVIGAERIAAGGDEIQAVVKLGPGEGGVGASGDDFGIKGGGVKGGGAGAGEDVLAEHIARAGAAGFAVQRVGAGGFHRGLAFHHLKAVGGHQKRLGGRVVAVVGATDALDEAFDVLWRSDLYHKVDIAPVDSKVERRGSDKRAELPVGHGGLAGGPQPRHHGHARRRAGDRARHARQLVWPAGLPWPA